MDLKTLLIWRKFGTSFELSFGGATATVTVHPHGNNQVLCKIVAPESVKVLRDNAKVRDKHG